MDTAHKLDTGKPAISLIPTSALNEEARVLMMGVEKYGKGNWRKGMAWSRLIDASLRHLTAYYGGEDIDPESGLSHLAHVRCNMAFLIEYQNTHQDLDDREKSASKERIYPLGESPWTRASGPKIQFFREA